jgi:hypothetical protein
MAELDLPTAKPSTIQENDLFGFGNTDETTNVIKNDQKEDLLWIIENVRNTKFHFDKYFSNLDLEF